MTESRRDPWLLTPGPLTTSRAVKEAMLHDWGSRDAEFIKLNARVRERLVELAGGQGTHVCVPLQGSGTFVVEAMIGTLVPPTGKLAVLVNGAYGERMVRMCEYLRRGRRRPRDAGRHAGDPGRPRRGARRRPRITHVVVVQCETTSGVLNPVEEIAAVTARHGRRLLDRRDERLRRAAPRCGDALPYDALVASVEQVPRGRAGHRLRHHPAGRARGCQGQRPLARPSISTTSGWRWRRRGSGASRRRPTCWPRSTRRSASTRPRAASPGGARATPTTAASWSTGCARSASRRCLPDALQAPIIVTVRMPADPQVQLRELLRPPVAPRLRHLSGQAHRRRQLPHRLHRAARRGGDARRAARHRRDPGRDRRPELRARPPLTP